MRADQSQPDRRRDHRKHEYRERHAGRDDGPALAGHGSDCRIRSYSVIRNSEIGDGVVVRPGCVLDEARIASGALIGPYSHLRPGSEIGEGAHVGNFVETTKVKLGKGSKANHLTYLCDAEVGAGVNIGAGPPSDPHGVELVQSDNLAQLDKNTSNRGDPGDWGDLIEWRSWGKSAPGWPRADGFHNRLSQVWDMMSF